MATLEMDDSNIIIGVKMLCQHDGSFSNYFEKMTQTGYNWTTSDAMSFASKHSECKNIAEGFDKGDIGIGAILVADSLNCPEGFASCKEFDRDEGPNLKKWIEKAEKRFRESHEKLFSPADLVVESVLV